MNGTCPWPISESLSFLPPCYLEAVARRDSVSALRTSLRARRDSLTAKMEALNQEADTAAMLEMAAAEGLDLADSATALGFLREYYPEMTATLEETEDLGGKFEELREGYASRSFRYALFTACAPVKLSRFGETGTGIVREARVREMAESRLRAARIWGGQEPDNVGELSPLVLHIDYGARNATFRKEVWEPLSGEFHIADVWTHSLSRGEAETDGGAHDRRRTPGAGQNGSRGPRRPVRGRLQVAAGADAERPCAEGSDQGRA